MSKRCDDIEYRVQNFESESEGEEEDFDFDHTLIRNYDRAMRRSAEK
jgi:hypothetical protein